jgi:hypothetical protein
MNYLKRLAYSVAVLGVTTVSVWASSQDQIRVSGALATDVQTITIEEIEAIGLTTISASSPSDASKRSFSGVWLDDFVAAYGADTVASIGFTAIDYYQVTFDRAEWERSKILLATRENGKVLEFETRGPMRVIVDDYDPNDELHQELTPKWIWMITEITFND